VLSLVSRSLLVLSCSEHKRSEPELLAAIERYDSPAFRVVRRFLRERPSKGLDIFIISAKFGLISFDQLIPNYDQRMTSMRVQELHPQVIAELEDILERQSYQELCLCMGRDYLQALEGYDKLVRPELAVTVVTGRPGEKLAELHRWLYGRASAQERFAKPRLAKGKGRLRGIEINVSSTQVLEMARRALVEGQGNPTNYYSWYVQVDDKRVAPKWLVSNLLRLPLNTFTTSDACRLLAQLGLDVRHT
jgi:hypothetical protein